MKRIPLLLAFVLLAGGCGRAAAPILGVKTVTAGDMVAESAAGRDPVVLDLREGAVYFAGHIPGAVRVDADGVPGVLVRSSVPRDRPVVVMAATENGAARAAAYASGAGYRDVRVLTGGMEAWRDAGGAVEEGLIKFATRDEARPPPLPDAASVTLAATAAAWMFRLAVVVLALVLLRGAPRAFGAGLVVLVAGEAATALEVLFAGRGGAVWAALRVSGVATGVALSGRAALTVPRRFLAVPLAALALLPLLFPLRPVLASIALPGGGDTVVLYPETLVLALRAVPVAAALLLLASAAGIRGTFGAGAGFVAYGLLRLVLAEALPGRPVFASAVEETILLAGLIVALILLRGEEEAEDKAPPVPTAFR